MTSFEHAMLGVNGALASGLHRQYDWRVAALAGLTAVSPDWDGATILGGMQLFDQAHRVWGHGLFTCLVVAIVLATLDYRYDLVGWGQRLLHRLLRSEAELDTKPSNTWRRFSVWLAIAVLAALSHLAADLVYSGAEGLSDWELKLLWPFSNRGFVYPMVRWGDAGATIIFVIGMFAMLRWKPRTQPLASATLACVIGYIALRGTLP
jgi:hypothetical protein